ncbi:MAG: hypothetical protein OEY14_07645, partial [Myxococcales bacterium]|nr:hypothetical protein [Myxococcales bacterium]
MENSCQFGGDGSGSLGKTADVSPSRSQPWRLPPEPCGRSGRRSPRPGAWIAALAFLLASLAPRQARAGNDDEILVGEEAALTGGAVTATVHSSGALIYNPAGIASAPEASLDASVSAFQMRLYRAPGLLRSAGGESADAAMLQFRTIPASVGYVRALGPRLRIGVGLFQLRSTEMLFQAQLRTLSATLQPIDWSVTVSDSAARYYASMGIGWRQSERLSFGVSAHLAYDVSSRAMYFSGSTVGPGGATFSPLASESLVGSWASLGVQLAVGAQWQPRPWLQLGAAMLSPGLRVLGSATWSHFVDGGGAGGATTGLFAAGAVLALGGGWMLPPRFRVGAALRIEDGWIGVDLDAQPGLRQIEIGVDRGLVVNARLGGMLRVADSVFLGLGLFTDRSAEPRVSAFGRLRAGFYGLTTGLHYRRSRGLVSERGDEEIQFETSLA